VWESLSLTVTLRKEGQVGLPAETPNRLSAGAILPVADWQCQYYFSRPNNAACRATYRCSRNTDRHALNFQVEQIAIIPSGLACVPRGPRDWVGPPELIDVHLTSQFGNFFTRNRDAACVWLMKE